MTESTPATDVRADESHLEVQMDDVNDEEELLLCCRFGELDGLQALAQRLGLSSLATARDDRGNSCLHMACANGHVDVVEYLLQHLPPDALYATNKAQNTPIHWASLNGHIPVLRLLCPRVPKSALEMKNHAGRTPLAEADERGTEASLEAAGYLLGLLDVEPAAKEEDGEATDAKAEADETGVESLKITDESKPVDD